MLHYAPFTAPFRDSECTILQHYFSSLTYNCLIFLHIYSSMTLASLLSQEKRNKAIDKDLNEGYS